MRSRNRCRDMHFAEFPPLPVSPLHPHKIPSEFLPNNPTRDPYPANHLPAIRSSSENRMKHHKYLLQNDAKSALFSAHVLRSSVAGQTECAQESISAELPQ